MEDKYIIVEEIYTGTKRNKAFQRSETIFEGNKPEIDDHMLDFVSNQINKFSTFHLYIPVDDILDGAFLSTENRKNGTIHLFKLKKIPPK